MEFSDWVPTQDPHTHSIHTYMQTYMHQVLGSSTHRHINRQPDRQTVMHTHIYAYRVVSSAALEKVYCHKGPFCIYTCIYVDVYIHTYIYIPYIYIYIYMSVYIYTYIYIYIY